jgi:hypothetical protein
MRFAHPRHAGSLEALWVHGQRPWLHVEVTRRVTARVTRWRDGEMRRRWCVAGLLRAESKFRRVKGHRALPTLIEAMEEYTRVRRSGIERGVA